MLAGKRILVAPLDWGLGHAARCVPLIRRLLEHGAAPVIAADGGPLALLRAEFPGLEHVRLPGITVRYAGGGSMAWSLARQFPAMVRSVAAEREAFGRLAPGLRLDAAISDQRFGVRSARLPSVLLTHQLFPFTPFARQALRRINLRHAARFDRCWVPDLPAAPGLAGELSHGAAMPAHARHIGPLSRMAPVPASGAARTAVAVVSGPEPQRTLLEQRLLEQLAGLPGEHLLVQGLPHRPRHARIGRVEVRSHLPADALADALAGAHLIVARSGYTTLMDLAALGRRALLIPTPGQPEQEYLARLHGSTGRFLVQRQEAIDLRAALSAPGIAEGVPPEAPSALLDEALRDLASLIG